MRKLFEYIRAFLKKGDMVLLALCVATTLIGIAEIASATNYMSSGNTRFIIIQTAAMLVGIGLYFVVTLIDVEVIANQRLLLTLFNTVAIGLLLFFGVEGNTGNKSWLEFSFLPFNIQPAEICKITFILIIAKTMAVRRDRISSFPSVFQLLLHTGFIMGLVMVFSRDTGVALPFAFIALVMAYAGGVHPWWFVALFALIAAGVPVLWNFFLQDYQKSRFLVLFDPTIDPYGLKERYQLSHSLDTLSGGGLTGQGLFHGAQVQSGRLPAQHTDFIFSSIGEELGLLGCLLVLALLVAIIARCVYVGSKSRSYMNRMICYGTAAMLIFQIAINVGMCIGVVPVIGLTLPFVSYGGSSIVTMYTAMGIVSGIKYRPASDTPIRYLSAY